MVAVSANCLAIREPDFERQRTSFARDGAGEPVFLGRQVADEYRVTYREDSGFCMSITVELLLFLLRTDMSSKIWADQVEEGARSTANK